MADNTGVSENLIEALGCGRFQAIMVFMVCIMTKLPVVYTFMFMSFGNYNPGWRCLDDVLLQYNNNNTLEDTNGTIIGGITGNTSQGVDTSFFYNNTNNNNNSGVKLNTSSSSSSSAALLELEYITDSCPRFEACRRVEFYPGDSTVVTEWGLICSRAWIPSLIISVQMAGALLGSYIAGQCSDSYGRKTTTYASLAAIGFLNIISMFSVSWHMFTVIRFFLGVGSGSVLAVYYVLTSEILTRKWRAPLTSVPAWNISAVLFSLTAMGLRDWRHLHLTTAILCGVCFLPVFWVPESLRWLEVKNKTKKFMRVANKIAKTNKKILPPMNKECWALRGDNEKSDEDSNGNGKQNGYTPLDLFHSGYKSYTVLMGILWIFMSLIYYAITFGVKSLYGDFYVNLILVFVVQLPFAIFPIVVPNILGRLKGSLLFLAISALGLLVATGFERLPGGNVKTLGTLIAIMAGKVGMTSGWDVNKVHLTELYPTVIRGLALGWACFMARIGGIVAPFLIPNTPDTIFICYAIMAVLSLVCCAIVFRFPETKGKPLKKTFDDAVMDEKIVEDDDDDDENADDGDGYGGDENANNNVA